MADAMRIVLVLALLCSIVIPCFAQDTVINACYSQRNGALRVVATPSDCSKSELPISWNITGPQGPQGIQGPPGPAPDMSAYYTKAQVDSLIASLSSQIAQLPTVYDFNGQFLGIGIDVVRTASEGGDINVYVPSLKRIAFFHFAEFLGQPGCETYFLYEGTNCDTQPYMRYNCALFVFHNTDKYYTGRLDEPIVRIMAQSMRDESNHCFQFSGPTSETALVKPQEVVLPFTLPVAPPLRFE